MLSTAIGLHCGGPLLIFEPAGLSDCKCNPWPMISRWLTALAAYHVRLVQMPEHALEEMSGSVAPLGIEATRSKSVVLPSSIADAGVRAVHGEQHC